MTIRRTPLLLGTLLGAWLFACGGSPKPVGTTVSWDDDDMEVSDDDTAKADMTIEPIDSETSKPARQKESGAGDDGDEIFDDDDDEDEDENGDEDEDENGDEDEDGDDIEVEEEEVDDD